MRMGRIMMGFMIIVGLCGCAGLKDVPQTIWGSSTRVLEDKRTNAMAKTYEKNYWDCLKAAVKTLEKKNYVIFKKDEVRGYMVVMGIPGSVDTTEVAVFIVELNEQQTRIELSSLSTNAKRILAKALFHGMDVAFGLAKADQEDGFSESEFTNGMTPEALLKAIENDGLSVPSEPEAIESLNVLLVDVQFYEHWLNKHRNMTLPQHTLDLIAIPTRSVIETRELNRSLLQETFTTTCPRIKSNETTEKTSDLKAS